MAVSFILRTTEDRLCTGICTHPDQKDGSEPTIIHSYFCSYTEMESLS